MTDRQVRITFQPHGRSIFVLRGTKILEAAARGGLTVDTPCGGQGTCGKCRVRLARGAAEPTASERETLSAAELRDGWRLACQSPLVESAVVEIPESSLFASQHRILTDAKTHGPRDVLPAVRKVYVELPPPSLEDSAPDLLRLQDELGPIEVGLDLLRKLGRRLRENGFRGTAVLTDDRLIGFEQGDTAGECYGAAFDVGTTTLVGSLVDLGTGREVAVESAINAQVRFGDDVLSRIKHAETAAGLEELRATIVEIVGGMIDRLCKQASARRRRIYEIAFSGNTTMQHLLMGIDPSQLGQVPFVPTFGRSVTVSAAELGLDIHPRAAAVLFPVIGGFVGGDTVAGMLATGLVEREGPALMVDIGTNGEIVLAHEGRIWAASTAAGPAFEGARISCGMRATAGAIEKVVFDGDVRVSVIGDVEPVGLCGSALVDLTAELLDCGIVSSSGRMAGPGELPAGLPEPLARRVILGKNNQPAFVLAEADGDRPAVTLTQKDVREIQLAAGAIRAGMVVLLKQAGLQTSDLNRVLIAGGFGSFIRRNHAQRIGLLPPGVDHRRIQYVGNASLSGAQWALTSTAARRRADDLARQARHVELSQDADFQMQFAEAMIFPE